jgi:ATP-dependent Clp protease protease subunit
MSDTKKNQMAVSSIYLLMEGITQESCSQAIHWIIDQNLLAERSRYPKDHLTLIINSPGGSVHACFALMDCMNMSRLPVHTIGLGLIASCGTLITMNGVKGHRTITTNTSILSHQYSWGSKGKQHELMAIVKEFEMSTERLINHYKRCTGLSETKIRKVLLPPEDVWLSPEEALKYKIIDKVIEPWDSKIRL